MGNCCKGGQGARERSDQIPLEDRKDQPETDQREETIQETRDENLRETGTEDTINDDVPSTRDENLRETGTEDTINDDVPSESESPRPLEVLEEPSVVSIGPHEEVSSSEELPRSLVLDGLSCYRASNILWSTGSFSEPIPNGFYSVVLDDRFNLFKSIPTLEELQALGDESLKAGVIIVDLEKDKKISGLIQLAIVEGHSHPDKVIKIGELAVDFYKQKSTSKTRQSFGGSHGFPLLGQISNGSCRARAILFKVLADAVNIKSKLMLVKGCPNDQCCPSDLSSSADVDSYNHMSAVVMLNDEEILVDLKRCPVKLIPMSSSSHSPLEPNSPMSGGYMDQTNRGSLSLSEPNIFSLHSQEKALRKQRSANFRSVRAINESIIQTLFSKEQGDNDITKSHVVQIWNEVLASPVFQNKPLLPNEECVIDSSALELGTRVGIGCSAEVFRGTWNETEVAVKIFTDQAVTFENIKDICNEIFILSRIKHPNVIMFYGVSMKPPQLTLVTEYVDKGSLYHLLYRTDEIKNLTWREKINILHDICRGLMCIHGMGIVHRDLKSSNCLLSNDWTVKLCDFGLSMMMEGTTVNDIVPAGTPEWVAPEVIRSEPFSEKCDIYSFGVIMWELSTLSKPWEGVPKDKVVNIVANEGARLDIPEGPLAKLIQDCWSEEPEQRPSCVEILTYLATCEKSLP